MAKRKGKKEKDISSLITRTFPHNIEAEKATLASILLKNDLFDEVYSMVDKDSFYFAPHQKIFGAMITLKKKLNSPIDLVTITDYLKKDKDLEDIGGEEYLIDVLNSVATPANAIYYAKIVRDKAVLRYLITTSTEIITDAYEEDEDVVQVLDNAEKKIFDISRRRSDSSFISIDTALHDVFERLEKIQMLTDKKILGLPTGFSRLDKLLSGLQSSSFVIFAGRPSMGKTAFALNVASNIALRNNFGVGIFSLEMPSHHLALRMLCAEGRIDSQLAFSGNLKPKDYGKLIETAGKFMNVPIYIDDTPNITLYDLKANARRMKDKHDIKLLIIDYIQLLQVQRTFKTESRQVEISEISRELKALARELEIPLIGISQLSRAVEHRTEDNRPRLSDLRESGALEQDADVVAFLYRGEYYRLKKDHKSKDNFHHSDDDFEEGTIDDKFGGDEVIIRKNRMGPIGTIHLKFIKEYTRFEELSDIEDHE